MFSGYAGPYFFDFEKKIIIKKQGKYLIEESIQNYDWEITDKKMKIDSFYCYKAITKIKVKTRRSVFEREITAWFTEEIPISAGPDGFGGLPGLIIQLENNEIITTLTKVEFQSKPNDIKFSTKGKKMTEKEFNELMKQLVESRNN